LTWFGHLANWERDPAVQARSQKLPAADNVYVLKTNSEFRIFFTIEKHRIIILDIATKATILSSGYTSATGQ